MRCATLTDELHDLEWTHVDFLSLDVEGHENAVLRGVDWAKVRIDYILCEKGCEEVLGPQGYRSLKLPPPKGKPPGTERLWARRGVPLWKRPR